MMICTAECSFRQNLNWVLTASSSLAKLHRPDPTPTPLRPRAPPRKMSRPVLNPAKGKEVCYDYQRREGCHFVSPCKYDHVYIKPHCMGTHPQWQHQSATVQEPNTKPTLNCRSSSEWYFDYRTSRSCHDHVVKCRH